MNTLLHPGEKMPWKASLNIAFETLVDFIYPPECVLCHCPGAFVCDRCAKSVRTISAPYCPVCGCPGTTSSASCSHCARHPLESLDLIRSVAKYEDDTLRTLIHNFKYEFLPILGKSLAPWLATCYTINQMNAQIIVPVPLHKSRQKFRGYNQSAVLAEALASYINVPVDATTLLRIKKTKIQMTLNASDRRRNVASAFRCHSDALAGKSVMLIDDVCTTGATLDACASALKKTGVSAVMALTLARAV